MALHSFFNSSYLTLTSISYIVSHMCLIAYKLQLYCGCITSVFYLLLSPDGYLFIVSLCGRPPLPSPDLVQYLGSPQPFPVKGKRTDYQTHTRCLVVIIPQPSSHYVKHSFCLNPAALIRKGWVFFLFTLGREGVGLLLLPDARYIFHEAICCLLSIYEGFIFLKVF